MGAPKNRHHSSGFQFRLPAQFQCIKTTGVVYTASLVCFASIARGPRCTISALAPNENSGENNGGLRMVWISYLRIDLNAGTAVLRRAQLGHFLQPASSH